MFRLERIIESFRCSVDRLMLALARWSGRDPAILLARGRYWSASPSVRLVSLEILRRTIANAPKA
jgi:hypothetical protein